MKADANRSGFTLIEVLLASLLLGISIAVLVLSAGRCLAAMKGAQNYQNARWVLAQGELDYPLIAMSNDVKSLEVSGQEYPGGFFYSRTVDDDDDEDGLYAVHAKASWKERNSESSEEVVFYVLFLGNNKKHAAADEKTGSGQAIEKK